MGAKQLIKLQIHQVDGGSRAVGILQGIEFNCARVSDITAEAESIMNLGGASGSQ
jgi:hypothetical protein